MAQATEPPPSLFVSRSAEHISVVTTVLGLQPGVTARSATFVFKVIRITKPKLHVDGLIAKRMNQDLTTNLGWKATEKYIFPSLVRREPPRRLYFRNACRLVPGSQEVLLKQTLLPSALPSAHMIRRPGVEARQEVSHPEVHLVDDGDGKENNSGACGYSEKPERIEEPVAATTRPDLGPALANLAHRFSDEDQMLGSCCCITSIRVGPRPSFRVDLD